MKNIVETDSIGVKTMAFLTFDKLNKQSPVLEKSANANQSKFDKTKMVFLSHRHDDKAIVKKVVGFLAQFNQSVYIDWLDNNMPQITTSDTADKLKVKINQSSKFLLLATPESIKSIWIPWELGLADGIKGMPKIAILPISNNENRWEEREYYGIYNSIQQAEDQRWGVFPSGGGNGVELGFWLNN